MVAKRKKSKLGHDPLAWVSSDDIKNIKDEKKESYAIGDNTKENANANVPIIEEIITEEIDIVIEEAADVITESETKTQVIVSENNQEVESMLDLPIYFGIAQVAGIHEQMQNILQTEENVIEINADDVESIDAAAVQLLISFSKSVKSKNKEIKWSSISENLKSSIDDLQVAEDLGLAA